MIGDKSTKAVISGPNEGRVNNRWYFLIPLLLCLFLVWIGFNEYQSREIPIVFEGTTSTVKPRTRPPSVTDFTNILPPFVDGQRAEKYLERYQFTSCTIPGNFEDLNEALACFLFNPIVFRDQNGSLSEPTTKICPNRPPFGLNNWPEWRSHLNAKNLKRLVLISSPFDRFARQYVRYCKRGNICLGCGNDVECFLRTLKRNLTAVAEGWDGSRSEISRTFQPQSWSCFLKTRFLEFDFVKIGQDKNLFVEDLNKFLVGRNVDRSLLDFIKGQIGESQLTLSEDEQAVQSIIKRDGELIKVFKTIYLHDYFLFGFDQAF